MKPGILANRRPCSLPCAAQLGMPYSPEGHTELNPQPHQAMKKTLLAALLALGITGSSCLGPDHLYNSVKNWNAELSEVDAVNEIVFIGLMIITYVPELSLGLIDMFGIQ